MESGGRAALVAATLAGHSTGPLVVVCAHPGDIDDFLDDLSLFAPLEAARFPSWESMNTEQLIHDEVYGDRLLAQAIARRPGRDHGTAGDRHQHSGAHSAGPRACEAGRSDAQHWRR